MKLKRIRVGFFDFNPAGVRRRNPMSTGAKVALGVAGLAAGGAVLYAMTREAPVEKKPTATGELPAPPRPLPGVEESDVIYDEQYPLQGGGQIHALVQRIQRRTDVVFRATLSFVQGMVPVPRVEQESFTTEAEALAWVQQKFDAYGAVAE